MNKVDDSPEAQIRRLEHMLDAASSQLIQSQEFYLKNLAKIRYYMKCLLSELEHIPDQKGYSNYLYKITMKDIRREANKKN